MSTLPDTRCPHCHDKLARERQGGTVDIFLKRLMINKSDGILSAVCQNCRQTFPVPAGLARLLRESVILPASGGRSDGH